MLLNIAKLEILIIKLREIMNRLVILLLFVFYSCAGTAVNRDYTSVLPELTYPNKEWSKDDFGESPSDDLKKILKTHKPRMFVDKDSCAPMDFYKQYLPRFDIVNNGQSKQANRKLLKKFERNFGTKLKLRKPVDCVENQHPPLYSFAWTEKMSLLNGEYTKIKILKYNFAFFKSGLPAGPKGVGKLSVVLGDTKLWHYLDIHGAIYYLLDEDNTPFALVLAEHDYFRSYVIGKDISIDESKNICFAKYSNEPYVCAAGTRKAPTAPGPKDMKWILGQGGKPLLGCFDVVPGVNTGSEVSYELSFLSSKDPLMVSWIHLGPDIKTWKVFSLGARNAPPGSAVFNAPTLKEIWKTAMYYYFNPRDNKTLEKHVKIIKSYPVINPEPIIEVNGPRFLKNIEEVKAQKLTPVSDTF